MMSLACGAFKSTPLTASTIEGAFCLLSPVAGQGAGLGPEWIALSSLRRAGARDTCCPQTPLGTRAGRSALRRAFLDQRQKGPGSFRRSKCVFIKWKSRRRKKQERQGNPWGESPVQSAGLFSAWFPQITWCALVMAASKEAFLERSAASLELA